jgi:hypothetical protein
MPKAHKLPHPMHPGKTLSPQQLLSAQPFGSAGRNPNAVLRHSTENDHHQPQNHQHAPSLADLLGVGVGTVQQAPGQGGAFGSQEGGRQAASVGRPRGRSSNDGLYMAAVR